MNMRFAIWNANYVCYRRNNNLKQNEGAAQTYVKNRAHKQSSKFTQDLFATYKFDCPQSTQQQELQ